jgi:hypothetical protein
MVEFHPGGNRLAKEFVSPFVSGYNVTVLDGKRSVLPEEEAHQIS